jgi:hypothetical protein
VSVRERAEHLITLADAATEGPWTSGGDYSGPWPDEGDPEPNYWRCWEWDEKLQDVKGLAIVDTTSEADAAFIAAARTEAVWVARRLLEALNRIEQLEAENAWLLGERRKL